MISVLIVTNENETAKEIQAALDGKGFSSTVVADEEKALEDIVNNYPDLIVVDMGGGMNRTLLQELNQGILTKKHPKVLALIDSHMLRNPESYLGADDFMVFPGNNRELTLRVTRLLRGNGASPEEVIKSGALMIDLANCEVLVGGKPIELTFREFELLKFLAREPGRVFSRESLLNKVWGYDYYGGDRTVDVHVRRIRSKIEVSGHTFIETVRNIGYRFKKES